MHTKSLQSCPNLCKPMDVARQALLSMGFFRQKYWSGLSFLFSEDLPDLGIKPMSPEAPALQEDSLQLNH